MDKITQMIWSTIVYADKITKPVDLLWHTFCRYVGQIIMIVGIIKLNSEIITVGALIFSVFLLNQITTALLGVHGELNHIHKWLKENKWNN